MKTTSIIGLIVGISLVCLLVAWQGLETVAGLLGEGGWGILLVCLFALPDLWLGAEAWRSLFPPRYRPPHGQTFLASSMGSAVNTLLPVATIGGEVAKARVLTHWSHSGIQTVSTMVVDKTVQALVILVWGVIGIAMLAAVVDEPEIVRGAVVGALLLALGIAGFIAVQLAGGFSFFTRSGARVVGAGKWRDIVDSADALDGAIRDLYRQPRRILAAFALRLVGMVLLVGEVILAGHLMGVPIGLGEAVLLKGLVVALRGMSFAIPGGFGIQEGGYVAIGALIGLPADLMIATSLMTRVREILPSIPLLLLWQHTEGKALWRKRRETSAGDGTAE